MLRHYVTRAITLPLPLPFPLGVVYPYLATQREPRFRIVRQRENVDARVYTRIGKGQRDGERGGDSPLKCTTGFSSLEGRSRPLLTLDRPTAPGYDVSNVQRAVPTVAHIIAVAVVIVMYLVPRSLQLEIKHDVRSDIETGSVRCTENYELCNRAG